MNAINVWLLDLGGSIYAAAGDRDLRYLLADAPHLTTIPNAPMYCQQVLVWQNAILPVMDLAHRILGHKVFRAASEELTVLATFQEHPDAQLRYGALLLGSIPARIQINDSQFCPLPEPKSVWRNLAQSCFKHEERGPIPVLDLARVFMT